MENDANTIKELGKMFRDKIEVCNDLLVFVNHFCEVTGGITGSFPRQLLELPFMLATYGDNPNKIYGNPEGKDIDMVIYDGVYNEEMTRKSINKLACAINDNCGSIELGQYIVTEILDATIYDNEEYDSIGRGNLHNIPHFQIDIHHKEDDKKKILLDIMGWYPDDFGGIKDGKHKYNSLWKSGDFDVNTLIYTANGIKTRMPDTFINIVNSIETKEAKCLIDLEMINEYANTQIHKISYMKQLAHFMGLRTKIVDNGYKMIGTIPEISIEKEEPCIITSYEPPYNKFKLECGHEFSVGSLTMILGTNEFKKECFLCRAPFVLKFSKTISEYVKKSYINYANGYSESNIENIKNDKQMESLEEYMKSIEISRSKPHKPLKKGHVTGHVYS